MGNYATNAHVTPRLGRTISASGTSPTTGQVDDWIALIEADLDGELEAQEFTVPVTDATGISFLRQYVVARACVYALQNKDSVTDGSDSTAQIEAFQAEWDRLIRDIRERPGLVAVKIGQDFGETAGKGRIRAYQTDNSESLSIDDGDFDTTFTRKKAR